MKYIISIIVMIIIITVDTQANTNVIINNYGDSDITIDVDAKNGANEESKITESALSKTFDELISNVKIAECLIVLAVLCGICLSLEAFLRLIGAQD